MSSGDAHIVIANWRAAVCYRIVTAGRPTRPSVSPRLTTTVRAPTMTVRAPRCGSSEQRGSSRPQGHRTTCHRHRRGAVKPTRWDILPSVQAADAAERSFHSTSLCCTCRSALGDCFIFLYVRPPSVDTPFRYTVLVPHHFSIPLGVINHVTVIRFVRAV